MSLIPLSSPGFWGWANKVLRCLLASWKMSDIKVNIAPLAVDLGTGPIVTLGDFCIFLVLKCC